MSNPSAPTGASATSGGGVLSSLPPITPTVGFSAAAPVDLTDEPDSHPTTTTNNPPSPGAAAVPPSIKVGNRLIFPSKPTRKWAWTPFASSARRDGCHFSHWVRANVEYADYPYARFDVHLDPLTYTDEEYRLHLAMREVERVGGCDLLTNDAKKRAEVQRKTSEGDKILPWTKAETDALMELAQAYDLRWPVIIDRWHARFGEGSISRLRKVEDLQHRYYSVGSVLAQRRAAAALAGEAAKLGGTGTAVGGPGASAPAAGTSGTASVAAPVASSVVKAEKDGAAPAAAPAAAGDAQPAAQQPPQPQQSSLDPTEADALRTAQKQTALHPTLAPPLSLPATGTAHHGSKTFDLASERARRSQLDRMWHRTKAEEREEAAVRAELRGVEAQLRKLKKAGRHLVPAGSALAAPPPAAGAEAAVKAGAATAVAPSGRKGASSSAAPTKPPPPAAALPPRPPLDPFFATHAEVSASFADTAPVPTPGTPYLQSGRLFPPSVEGHAGLNKSTLKQMGAILEELKVPKEPIPTRRACDLYDGVRKEALTLLILQKMVLRKEAELTAKREKLAGIKKGAEDAAAAAAAAATAAKSAGEAKDGKKPDAKAEAKGGKSTTKKAAGAKGKASKRPRADSNTSQGSAGKSKGGAKKGDGGPKKKPRKKAAAKGGSAEAAVAAAAASMAQTTGAVGGASAAAVPPAATAASTATDTATAAIPVAGAGQKPPPAAVPAAAAAATAAAVAPPADQPAAAASSSAPVVHPGTAPGKSVGKKKPGRKPRGRKKAS